MSTRSPQQEATYQRKRAWQAANRERCAEYSRKWATANPERRRSSRKRYDAAHRDVIRERACKYRSANREKFNESAAASQRKHKTGFDRMLFASALARQNHACAICARPFTSERKPHADHCHDSKTPRGVLCRHCNQAEGLIKKTGMAPEEFGQRLAAYLSCPTVKEIL